MFYFVFVAFGVATSVAIGSPIVLKGSSASDQTVIAISASDTNLEQQILKNANTEDVSSKRLLANMKPADVFQRSFTFANPNGVAAGSGRSFVAAASYNPFMFPLFHFPINLEGYGLNSNMGLSNIFKGFENFYEPSFGGGGVNSVSAVNENGHMYGKINSVSFDNRPKGQN